MHDLLYSAESDSSSPGSERAREKNRLWATLAAGGLALIVALLDFSTPVDVNVALFYSGTILACAWTRSRSRLRIAAAVCVSLTVLAACFSPAPHVAVHWPIIWLNRAATVMCLLVETLLVDAWIGAQKSIDERSILIRDLGRTFDLAQAIVRETNGKILFWSKGAQRLYGWSAAEATGTISHQLLRTEFPAPFEEINRQLQASSRWTGQLRHFRKSGEEVWVASHWSLGTGVADNVQVVIEVNNEISDLKRSEKELATSEQRFRRISEANVVGVTIADPEKIHEANDHFLTMLGYRREEAGAMLWRDLIPPEHINQNVMAFQRLRDSGSAAPFETELFAKDRSRVPVLIGSVKLDRQFLSFVVDQTERKKLQTQLARAQKLDSIGKLAGGIAHDFNNLLTIIIGHVQLLLDGLQSEGLIASSLEEISEAANRAAELTAQLLAFSRHQPTDIRNVALNDFVRDLEGMLRRLIKENIEMEVMLDAESGTIQANTSQLEQVLFNLVVNARDAMPNGGKLLIETEKVTVDPDSLGVHPGLKPGRYAMLVVSDSGVGMPAEVQSHIFEPFFTTKEPGKGTGLGLATVYGIVTKMGGSISLYSEPGEGTVFKLLFPVVAEAPDAAPPKIDAHEPAAGHGTVLVVEDEPAVRDYIRHVLESHGYRVFVAANGREALNLAKLHKDLIDLLVTDAIMPEMGGEELTARLLEVRPGIPVLRMSGYTDRMWNDSAKEIVSIQKPFTPRALLRAVKELVAE